MNSYFATVRLNLASNFPPTTGRRQGATSSPKDNRTLPLLEEVHFSSLPIRNKIEALNAKKTMGPDIILLKLLRLAGAIIPSLEHLYRYSIETKTVYTSWKRAKSNPVFKKDNETDRGNYRPISLLSVPSKILESLVQPRSQGLSSLPPLVVGIKTLVAAGHVTTQNLGGKKFVGQEGWQSVLIVVVVNFLVFKTSSSR